ncbi:hypothetical protein NQZ79_g2351 [Umbelopsis isabellina]|nr:hypothetical protein NQZ79_g2351 [Umbelopsis isabellina]
MSQKLSEYERERQKNIERNKELLKQLKVPSVGSQHGLPTAKKAEPAAKKSGAQHKAKPVKKEKLAPSRASARLRGIAADANNEEGVKRTAEEFKELQEAKKPKRVAKLEGQEHQDFLKILEDTKMDGKVTVKIPNDGPPSDKVPKTLQEEASNLDIRHIWPTVKVTPERINFAAFHPSSSKILACAGDMSGSLGFWDVNAEKEDPDEEHPQPVVYTYRPHTRSVTCMMYNPGNASQLYTSSYDGTIQYFDMEKATFVNALEDKDSGLPFTNFDMTHDGQNIWFSTSDGTVGHYDMRSPKSNHSTYNLREKKVGCISLNLADQNYLACASNDRSATIWDVRHMKKNPKPLLEFEHGYAVSACYWSPNGKKLLTTSYDNRLRVMSTEKQIKDMELEHSIEHNNRTGKWVTLFRAKWNYNPSAFSHSHFCVASMNHPVEIYSGETGERICELYDPEKVTAVPAVCLFHPTTPKMTVLSGNGSGRMACWS